MKNLKIHITDTTNILNKGGIDKIGYNKMVPKHKISKLSIICDGNGTPLNCELFKGNIYDSKILEEQLNNKYSISPTLNDQNKEIFLADSAYDSRKLMEKIRDKGYKNIIIPQNKRNIKNKSLIRKMTESDKKIFKKRNVIERKNSKIKSYKRLNTRYDKYSSSYMGFVYLSFIIDIVR